MLFMLGLTQPFRSGLHRFCPRWIIPVLFTGNCNSLHIQQAADFFSHNPNHLRKVKMTNKFSPDNTQRHNTLSACKTAEDQIDEQVADVLNRITLRQCFIRETCRGTPKYQTFVFPGIKKAVGSDINMLDSLNKKDNNKGQLL